MRKMIILVAIVMSMMVILTGCGNTSEKVVGVWEMTGKSEIVPDIFPSTANACIGAERCQMELFSDGTIIMKSGDDENYNGFKSKLCTYEIVDERFKAVAPLGTTIVSQLEISRSKLVLTDENGNYVIFEK